MSINPNQGSQKIQDYFKKKQKYEQSKNLKQEVKVEQPVKQPEEFISQNKRHILKDEESDLKNLYIPNIQSVNLPNHQQKIYTNDDIERNIKISKQKDPRFTEEYPLINTLILDIQDKKKKEEQESLQIGKQPFHTLQYKCSKFEMKNGKEVETCFAHLNFGLCRYDHQIMLKTYNKIVKEQRYSKYQYMQNYRQIYIQEKRDCAATVIAHTDKVWQNEKFQIKIIKNWHFIEPQYLQMIVQKAGMNLNEKYYDNYKQYAIKILDSIENVDFVDLPYEVGKGNIYPDKKIQIRNPFTLTPEENQLQISIVNGKLLEIHNFLMAFDTPSSEIYGIIVDMLYNKCLFKLSQHYREKFLLDGESLLTTQINETIYQQEIARRSIQTHKIQQELYKKIREESIKFKKERGIIDVEDMDIKIDEYNFGLDFYKGTLEQEKDEIFYNVKQLKNLQREANDLIREYKKDVISKYQKNKSYLLECFPNLIDFKYIKRNLTQNNNNKTIKNIEQEKEAYQYFQNHYEDLQKLVQNDLLIQKLHMQYCLLEQRYQYYNISRKLMLEFLVQVKLYKEAGSFYNHQKPFFEKYFEKDKTIIEAMKWENKYQGSLWVNKFVHMDLFQPAENLFIDLGYVIPDYIQLLDYNISETSIHIIKDLKTKEFQYAKEKLLNNCIDLEELEDYKQQSAYNCNQQIIQIGIDSEGYDTFLIQIATRSEIFIFDMMYLSPQDKQLRAFILKLIESPNIQIIGQSVYQDLRDITKKFQQKDIVIRNFININEAFKTLDPSHRLSKLSYICEQILNKKLSKLDQVSNWKIRPLSKHQLHYAALDAYIPLIVYDEMVNMYGKSQIDQFFVKEDKTQETQQEKIYQENKKQVNKRKCVTYIMDGEDSDVIEDIDKKNRKEMERQEMINNNFRFDSDLNNNYYTGQARGANQF